VVPVTDVVQLRAMATTVVDWLALGATARRPLT